MIIVSRSSGNDRWSRSRWWRWNQRTRIPTHYEEDIVILDWHGIFWLSIVYSLNLSLVFFFVRYFIYSNCIHRRENVRRKKKKSATNDNCDITNLPACVFLFLLLFSFDTLFTSVVNTYLFVPYPILIKAKRTSFQRQFRGMRARRRWSFASFLGHYLTHRSLVSIDEWE